MIGAWVAAGGGLGALARYGLGTWLATLTHTAFPWPTFLINVLGSALLGFFIRGVPPATASSGVRAFLTIGLCGGFTTFSAFDLQTFLLLRQAEYLAAGAYSLGSTLTCIAGVIAGMWLAARLQRPRRLA